MKIVIKHLECMQIFSRAFDRGNYCAAYEVASEYVENGLRFSTNSILPAEHRCDIEDEADELGRRLTYAAGFVLGFYSSYERHEIPEGRASREIFDSALTFAVEHLFDHHRDESFDDDRAASEIRNHAAAVMQLEEALTSAEEADLDGEEEDDAG